MSNSKKSAPVKKSEEEEKRSHNSRPSGPAYSGNFGGLIQEENKDEPERVAPAIIQEENKDAVGSSNQDILSRPQNDRLRSSKKSKSGESESNKSNETPVAAALYAIERDPNGLFRS